MKFKKILGWVLLLAGLVIIFTSLYFSYRFFTSEAKAPEIFKLEQKTESLSEQSKTIPTSPEALQKEMQKMIEQQLKEIIPPEFLSKLLNLISWSIFAGILIFGGSRISGIGIRLIKGA